MQNHQGPLSGRVALVTGSGANIGEAIALRLARDGASVVINGHRNLDRLEHVAEEIRASGSRALPILADVSDPVAVTEMVRHATSELGKIDIAVSNVGVRLFRSFLDISIEEWHSIMESNLSAAFYLDRLVLPDMKINGWGRVIHISGYDGFTGHIPNRAHNIVCKAGLHAMVKAIAKEFGEYGITANTVVPGAIDTKRDWSQYPNLDVKAKRMAIPVKRFGTTQDIAEACAYLVNEHAGFVNGQAIHVNGGEYMF